MSEKKSKKQSKSKKVQNFLKKAATDFNFFVVNVFSKSFDHRFVAGDYIDNVCTFLENNSKTIRIGPRDHFKSTSFYAHFMWQLFRARFMVMEKEFHYFSYKNKMASYHVGSPSNEDNIKSLINRNPFFEKCIDDKSGAESIGVYSWPNGSKISLTSNGLLTFTRGMHTKGVVYIDDPLQDEDPHKKLAPARVRTINSRIKTTVYPMPQFEAGAELHIVGTPQTEEDFFFDQSFTKKFTTMQKPAILDNSKKKVLWPEFRPWGWVQDKKDTLPKDVFLQEYMCKPTYSTDSFLDSEDLAKCLKPDLINYADSGEFSIGDNHDVIAGLDIGKHQHPSHLAVYQVNEDGVWIQRVSKWLDGWGYTEQIEYCEEVMNRLGISMLYYDATRGEFESMEEQGKLPDGMVGISLTTRKSRFNMARTLAQKIEKDIIKLIDDKRQYRQMLVVDTDLKAMETREGHGDSFWSNALCMNADYQIGAAVSFV